MRVLLAVSSVFPALMSCKRLRMNMQPQEVEEPPANNAEKEADKEAAEKEVPKRYQHYLMEYKDQDLSFLRHTAIMRCPVRSDVQSTQQEDISSQPDNTSPKKGIESVDFEGKGCQEYQWAVSQDPKVTKLFLVDIVRSEPGRFEPSAWQFHSFRKVGPVVNKNISDSLLCGGFFGFECTKLALQQMDKQVRIDARTRKYDIETSDRIPDQRLGKYQDYQFFRHNCNTYTASRTKLLLQYAKAKGLPPTADSTPTGKVLLEAKTVDDKVLYPEIQANYEAPIMSEPERKRFYRKNIPEQNPCTWYFTVGLQVICIAWIIFFVIKAFTSGWDWTCGECGVDKDADDFGASGCFGCSNCGDCIWVWVSVVFVVVAVLILVFGACIRETAAEVPWYKIGYAINGRGFDGENLVEGDVVKEWAEQKKNDVATFGFPPLDPVKKILNESWEDKTELEAAVKFLLG